MKNIKKIKKETKTTLEPQDNSVLGKHYKKVYDHINSYPLDYNNLANTLLVVMESVDVEKISGPSKKDLVIKIMAKLIKDLEMTEEDRESMSINCNKFISNYIDVLVCVTKGQTSK